MGVWFVGFFLLLNDGSMQISNQAVTDVKCFPFEKWEREKKDWYCLSWPENEQRDTVKEL